mmetsp:Transcript_27423/g.60357  ORF Transcript_27423/g.60357 Transcript_27423/m.60357 type:complete len:633 (+) Transcript_27423:89-1987(+)|eukprot:CAMPEP_0168301348 /NCGR_PEP_ID=MMETSP0142_2-20121227/34472_1 /TAXON_ID=44445 /ORGANISM="Pseudo-nitzschia australis, Strain 10249 10 AB" /LENGTH=632 /DNA_ID=CAMNT_0008251581 /DNA_START=74 /DNA_END=1972 /DNA_ORIENTATION=+
MADNAAAAVDDWRKSVLQSYRSTEVKEIANVLAALEGSASVTPTSKLMLASRFEDSIFKSARSLADYRKKIAKRLKKLQKNYKASEPEGKNKSEAKEELTNELQREYGEELRYIVYNAATALEDLKHKLGPEKAKQLQQHTDCCRTWALDLGILSRAELDAIKKNNDETSNIEQSPKPPSSIREVTLSKLNELKEHLKTRVRTIRSYVVKHADADRFLQETLQSKDVDMSKNVMAGNMFRDVLKEMISTQKEHLKKASATIGGGGTTGVATSEETSRDDDDVDEDPLIVLQKALEKAHAGVPPPTRQDSRQLEGSLRHLDKIRAASTAMMTYWTLPGDQRLTTAPRDTLKKIHEVVEDGTDFVLEAVKELERQKRVKRGLSSSIGEEDSNEGTTKVSLQDAWSKTIELPSAAPIAVGEEIRHNNDNTNNKRPRTNSYKPYYKSRMLFRPNRKTPQELLAAIRRKGARLKLANSGDANAIHLVVDFERAFTMTIYFSPLTVTLRAKTAEETADSSDTHSNGPTAIWQHLSHGLTPWGSTLDSSDFRRRQQDREEQVLNVWGVTGSYEGIGRVVEERLRDASTHATSILRKCFRNHVKDKTVEFEVELLEGSALLDFLQVTRSTYMPNWEDKDF